MFIEHKEQGEVKELDEASKLLLKAAAEIEKRGHAKGVLCDPHTGGVCARGAIFAAANGHPLSRVGIFDERSAVRKADERLSAAVGGFLGGNGVPEWNNAPERTQAEVVAKLRAVALGL